MELEVVDGDITQLEVDAIANAANDHLWMGAGVAGAIKRAGRSRDRARGRGEGPDRGRRRRRHRRRARLPARHVIHGAVMGQDLRTNAATVARTTTRLPRGRRRARREIACAACVRHRRRRVPARRVRAPSWSAPPAPSSRQTLERVVFAVYGADAERGVSKPRSASSTGGHGAARASVRAASSARAVRRRG